MYNPSPQVNMPRFSFKRDFNKLTKDKLKLAVAKNLKLQNLTQLMDPNLVAETLQNELNNIIDHLAPQKRIIRNKDNQPFLTSEIRDKMFRINQLLTQAIKTKNKDDWKEFRHNRNLLYKVIDAAKSSYISKILNHNSKGWGEIKKYNGLEKAVTPSKIVHQGLVISSPKIIANVANNHYISKIENFNKKMANETRDPILLLSKLIPRNNKSLFKIKYISFKRDQSAH